MSISTPPRSGPVYAEKQCSGAPWRSLRAQRGNPEKTDLEKRFLLFVLTVREVAFGGYGYAMHWIAASPVAPRNDELNKINELAILFLESMIDLDTVFALPVFERVQLVEAIWNSVAHDSDKLELQPWQAKELDRRMADFKRNPTEGLPWAEVKRQLFASE